MVAINMTISYFHLAVYIHRLINNNLADIFDSPCIAAIKEILHLISKSDMDDPWMNGFYRTVVTLTLWKNFCRRNWKSLTPLSTLPTDLSHCQARYFITSMACPQRQYQANRSGTDKAAQSETAQYQPSSWQGAVWYNNQHYLFSTRGNCSFQSNQCSTSLRSLLPLWMEIMTENLIWLRMWSSEMSLYWIFLSPHERKRRAICPLGNVISMSMFDVF